MGDRAFGMLRSDIGMAGLAMGDGFLEMRDTFIQMRILHAGRHGMLECFFTMLHHGIGMARLSMGNSFLGMGQSFIHMFVPCKSKPAQQWETSKRGNCRQDQCSAMHSHFHGFLLRG